MAYRNRISQMLQEEHRSTVGLMERLERFIARHRRGGPPDVAERGVAPLLADLSTAMQTEVQRHFAFEEEHLFSYLSDMGDDAIGTHLTDEHTAIRPIGIRMAEMARAAATQGFDQASWEEFRRLGLELCERMLAHVQKEEMALLPLIEESMDADTEERLHEEYSATV